MTTLKSFARDWCPPIIEHWLRKIRGGSICFEGDYATWAEASSHSSGYDAVNILAKVLDATLKVKHGDALFERDSVLFNEIEYVWPVLSGLMWTAAHSNGHLNVLDFGGALGSSYFQNRKFLQSLPELHWSVVEQTHYVKAGKGHIQDEHLRFYETIEDCLIENQPNVILLSSVLQYLESPIDILKKISLLDAACLIIDRTPISTHSKDKILVQQVPPSIYKGSYPMWVFSRDKFMSMLDSDWLLVESYLSDEAFVQATDKFEFSFQGMLLEARR